MIAQKTKKIQKGLVNELTRVSKSLYLIRFTPHTPVDIKPGQFVSVLCDNLTLRRPFSVMDYEDGVISILFKKKGAGTTYISNLKQGDEIDFVGPMGNGFNIERKKSLLISAGVGSAPVFYLHKKMEELDVENFFASGFVSKEEIPSNLEFDMITTDDGSEGKKGSIVNYVEGLILSFNPEKIYCCGPEIVLKLIVQTAEKHSIKTEVAMEKVMACSIGVCKGCVIKIKKDGKIQNATVCHDGPVFDGGDVVWQ